MNHSVEWAAGFFEGEGHVKCAKRGEDRWFSLEVAQVYREPLDKLQELFGGKVYGPYRPYTSQRKPYYMYVAYGQVGLDAIEQMMPYLFHKGDQAKVAVKEWESRVGRTKAV